jgi:hypothetical protein
LGHANKVLIIIAFSFRQFLADFSIFEKEQKSKAIAFTFRPFLATFSIVHKWEKKQQKSKAIIALTFRPFLATFFISKERLFGFSFWRLNFF